MGHTQVRPLSELRELAADGVVPFDTEAVLLLDFWKGGNPAREFRTSTLSGPDTIPPLVAVVTDPATQVEALEKSPRNPYDGFLFLGRASTCDIIVRDTSVSKTHAVIEPKNGRYTLRDNRSRNGTWHNGVRLTDGERILLTSGDAIVLGSYPVYFVVATELVKLLARGTSRAPRA
jgi:pSer/pThr/pTyr-binding forkhead associated (FHA) protein